jgi:alcohol dehydrogenase class IV
MTSRVYFGFGEFDKLKTIIKDRRVCLIVGKTSFNSTGCDRLLKDLHPNQYIIHDDFSTNPSYLDIILGVKKIHEFKPEIIVGIGGGSVLDTAKLLSILPNSADKIKKTILKNTVQFKRSIELCLIPTTSGSGSEATHFAVLYFEEKKYSITSKFLLPDYVILDPFLTESLPKELALISAFDAFSQSIEAIWSINSNEESREYGSKALKLLNDNIDGLYNNPSLECKKNLMEASFLAGKAINISKTTLPHALSYFLTINYNIPHGLAVFLMLRKCIFYNSPSNISKLKNDISVADYLIRFDIILNSLNLKNVHELSQRIEYLIKSGNFPTSFIGDELDKNVEIHKMADAVNIERLNNNPMLIESIDIINLLNLITNDK